MDIHIRIFSATLEIFLEAAPYILLGVMLSSLLKLLMPPGFIARHLGRGRIRPVLKAALWGIPLPL
jgi:uncharacterized membrane protein YraQ (UPF0718 family)